MYNTRIRLSTQGVIYCRTYGSNTGQEPASIKESLRMFGPFPSTGTCHVQCQGRAGCQKRDYYHRFILSQRMATSLVDNRTGTVTYFRVCPACEESFRRETWESMSEHQRSVFPADWCLPAGVERDIRRQGIENRWQGTFGNVHTAIREIRLENAGMRTFHAQGRTNQTAREAGELFYSNLLWMNWATVFAQAGEMMIERYNQEVQLEELRSILEDETSPIFQQQYSALETAMHSK